MKSKEIVEMEIRNLIESSLVTLAETKRIMSNKEMSDYEKGRTEGIILIGKDFIDNFIRFADRIGIKLKKQQEKK